MTHNETHRAIWLKHVEKLKQKKHIHHISMAIQSVDGSFKADFHEGQRDASGAPITKETPFMIASVTKLFITTAILKLHEQGKLDVLARIANYLDDTLLEGIHVYQGKSYHQDLCVWHLLTHTSGILDYIEIKDTNKQTIFDRVIEGEDQAFTIADMLEIVKTSSSAYFPPQSLKARKKKARYSDTNFQLLRAVIEQVAKQPYDTVL